MIQLKSFTHDSCAQCNGKGLGFQVADVASTHLSHRWTRSPTDAAAIVAWFTMESGSGQTSCRIRVLARFRPLSDKERNQNAVAAEVRPQCGVSVLAKDNAVRLESNAAHTFTFDAVLYVGWLPVCVGPRISPMAVCLL